MQEEVIETNTDNEDIQFEELTEDENKQLKQNELTPQHPPVGTKEWSTFLLAQLDEDEKIKDAPTCEGLRRLVEKNVGPIINKDIDRNEPPKTERGIATVVVRIEVQVENPKFPYYTNIISESEIADCGLFNTEQKYALHMSATAATRAEGRALRKILRLHNIHTAEEIDIGVENNLPDGWTPDVEQEFIEDAQITIIDTLCKRLDIHPLDIINAGSKQYPIIEKIPKNVAVNMIQFLSDIQRGAKQKPQQFKCYQESWR